MGGKRRAQPATPRVAHHLDGERLWSVCETQRDLGALVHKSGKGRYAGTASLFGKLVILTQRIKLKLIV